MQKQYINTANTERCRDFCKSMEVQFIFKLIQRQFAQHALSSLEMLCLTLMSILIFTAGSCPSQPLLVLPASSSTGAEKFYIFPYTSPRG